MTPEQFEQLLENLSVLNKTFVEICAQLAIGNALCKERQYHATGAMLDEHEHEG